MAEQEDVLLRVQSEVAQGLAGLQAVLDQLRQLSGAGRETEEQFRRGTRATDDQERSFSRLQSRIIAFNQAWDLTTRAYHAALGILDRVVLSHVHHADALERLSQRTGVAASTLSSYTLGLRQAHTDVTTLAGSLEMFERRLQSADRQGGRFRRFIQEVFHETPKQLLAEPDKLVEKLSEVYYRASPQQRSALAQQLGGRFGGRELIPFLSQGPDAIRAGQEEMRKVGAIMGEDFVRASAKATAEMERIKIVMDGIYVTAAQKLFPIFERGLTALLGYLTENREDIAKGIATFFERTASALERAAPTADALATAIGRLASLTFDPNSAISRLINFATENPMLMSMLVGGTVGYKVSGSPWGAAVGAYEGAVAVTRPPGGKRPTIQWTPAPAELQREELERQVAANQERRAWAKETFGDERLGRIPYPGAEQQLAALQLPALPPGGAPPAAAPIKKRDRSNIPKADFQAYLRSTGAGGGQGIPGLEDLLSGGEGDKLTAAQIAQRAQLATASVEVEQATWKAMLDTQQIQQVEYLRHERDFAMQKLDIQEEAAKSTVALAEKQGDKAAVIKAQTDLQMIAFQRQQTGQQYIGQIGAAETAAADQYRSILAEVNSLTAQAFGTETEQKLQSLATAYENMVDRLKRSGHAELIAQVRDAYDELEKQAQSTTINIGQMIRQGFQQSYAGIIAGTRNAGALIEGVGKSMEARWADAIGAMIEDKFDFDISIKKNFLEDIPSWLQQGGEKIKDAWGSLFGGGAGAETPAGTRPVASQPTAQAEAQGGPLPSYLLRGGNPFVAATAAPAAGTTAVAPTAGAYGGTLAPGTGGGYTFTNELGETFSAPTAAAAANAGSGSPAAAGAAAGAGAAVPYAMIVLAAIGGLTGAIQEANKHRWDLDRSGSQAGTALGGWIGGALGAIGLGAIGKPLASGISHLPTWAAQANAWQLGPIEGALVTLLSHQKLRGTIIAKGLGEEWVKAGLPQQHVVEVGGRTGLRTRLLGTPLDEAEAQRWRDLGFPLGPNETIAGASGAYGSRGRAGGLYSTLAAATAARPEVSNLRFNQALGLAAVLAPRRGDARNIANRLVNNLLLQGVDETEAKRQLRAFAEAQGIDLFSSLQTLQSKYQAGKYGKDKKSTEQYEPLEALKTDVNGIIELFKSDMPAAIDVAGITMSKFSKDAGINIGDLEKDLQRALSIFEGFQTTATLRGALGASTAGGRAGSYRATARQNFLSTLVTSATEALGRNDQYEQIFAPSTSLLNEAAVLFEKGDIGGAEKKLREAEDAFNGATEQGVAFTEMVDNLAPSIGEAKKELEALSKATDLAGNAMQAALGPLVSPDPAEELSRSKRIESLKFAIEQAKLFGDTIQQAQLEMELATEQAAARFAGGAGAPNRFLQAIREGIKTQVMEGFTEAILQSSAIQAVLAPYLQHVKAGVEALVADPSKQASIVQALTTEWTTTVKPAMDLIAGMIAQVAPVMENVAPIQYHDIGGIVGGIRRFEHTLVKALPGEMILNQRQQEALLQMANTIRLEEMRAMNLGGVERGLIINLSVGNLIGDRSGLGAAARELADMLYRQIQLQGPIAHLR